MADGNISRDGYNTDTEVTFISREERIYFNEANLANGTAPDISNLTQRGKFVFETASPLKELMFNYRAFIYDDNGKHIDDNYYGTINIPIEIGREHALHLESVDCLSNIDIWRQDEGEVNYEFTLTKAFEYKQKIYSIHDAGFSVFYISTENLNGPFPSIQVRTIITDDTPRLLDTPIHELGANATPSVTGNVNDYVIKGADPTHVNHQWWADPDALKVEFAQYGALTLGDDGSYSFAVDPQSEALKAVPTGEFVNLQLPFAYQDWDGDPVQGNVQFKVEGTGILALTPRPGNVPVTVEGELPPDNPYVPGSPSDPDRNPAFFDPSEVYDPMNPNWGITTDGRALLRVFESGLFSGSEAGERNFKAHSFLDIETPAALQSMQILVEGNLYDFPESQYDYMPIEVNGGLLSFKYDQTNNFVYCEFQLVSSISHETGNGINADYQLAQFIAIDNNGKQNIIDIAVQIIDDAPLVKEDLYFEINISSAKTQIPRIWNVLMEGADLQPWSFNFNGLGEYGTLEMGQGLWDINYSPDANKADTFKYGDTVIDSFDYIYTDGDGDGVNGKINIVVKNDIEPTPPSLSNISVNESNFVNGAVIALDGFEIQGIVNDGLHGTVVQGTDGLWRYILNESLNSGYVQGTNVLNNADSFILRIKDKVGNEFNVTGAVDIIDSVPSFTAGQNSLTYDFGADSGPSIGLKVEVTGAARDLIPGVETMIAGQHGMLTLSPDGSCHYSPDSDYAGEDRFDFTIIDSDGDRALATVVASMVDGASQTTISIQTADELAAAEIEALGVPDVDSDAFFGA